jgi:hypothetical protein
MGDIAEMHLDGTLCETCGTFLGETTGYPRYCRACRTRSMIPDRFEDKSGEMTWRRPDAGGDQHGQKRIR